MKKAVSSLLCTMLLFGAVPALCVMPVSGAATDYQAELWNPVEIKLTSTVQYANAYTDAELDAVFTHEDGTVISLPGFWDGGQNWCVRFSPTKTGVWTYKTTCSNAEDAGLITSGTVKAVPSTGTSATAKHGFIKISENKRYYVHDDGTPFLWLGDTFWQAPENIPYDENNYPYSENDSALKEIVDNRVAKGYTVFQTYFNCNGGNQGVTSYWISKGRKIRPEVFRDRIDKMFQYVHESGMVIAMGFGLHSGTPTSFKEEYHLRFIRYCVARYACYNIVWITGQEITNIEQSGTAGKTNMDVWIGTAELTDRLDGYRHPQGAHMYPMNATDERAQRLHNAAWHDSWFLQGGHGQDGKWDYLQGKSFYRSYYTLSKVKPIIETEANYEEINSGVYTGYNATRTSAWKAMMSGCAGYTYGGSGTWLFCYSTAGRTQHLEWSYEPWYMSLNKAGSYEVGYMKHFFEVLPDWTKLVPRFDNAQYADFAASSDKYIASTDDGHTVVCCFLNQDTSTGTVLKLAAGQTYTALWFNPLTGKFLPADVQVSGSTAVLPPKPNQEDWALVLTCDALSKTYTLESPFADLSSRGSAVTGGAVTPKSVTAICGLTYNSKQQLTDNTSYLYDNDASTVWRPFADRTSHTILYDLGTAQNLTHIVIEPLKGTTLPRYRVEGSGDGVSWTIIVNTRYREPLKNGDAISEPLDGAYRYVKVQFLPPDDVSEDAAKASGFEYAVTMNRYYYRTAITGITVYSSGEAEIVPTESVVTPDGAETPTADNADAVPGNTAAPDAREKKSNNTLLIVLIAAVTLVIAACAAVLILKPKKKK
ncbi:MAG: DUF4038 domain-containing protein [Clostridia bacterium]|nr:DUF4038 domain-containing protein [Clostridia bacterium]